MKFITHFNENLNEVLNNSRDLSSKKSLDDGLDYGSKKGLFKGLNFTIKIRVHISIMIFDQMLLCDNKTFASIDFSIPSLCFPSKVNDSSKKKIDISKWSTYMFPKLSM
jgi:hypothetical protein